MDRGMDEDERPGRGRGGGGGGAFGTCLFFSRRAHRVRSTHTTLARPVLCSQCFGGVSQQGLPHTTPPLRDSRFPALQRSINLGGLDDCPDDVGAAVGLKRLGGCRKRWGGWCHSLEGAAAGKGCYGASTAPAGRPHIVKRRVCAEWVLFAHTTSFARREPKPAHTRTHTRTHAHHPHSPGGVRPLHLSLSLRARPPRTVLSAPRVIIFIYFFNSQCLNPRQPAEASPPRPPASWAR